MSRYEFDNKKSRSSLEKHGIDFHDAQELWQDPDLLQLRAKSEDEERYLVIGRIGSKHWSAVINYRNESIRLISVRRFRRTEIELYESQGI